MFQGKDTKEGADVGTTGVALSFEHPDDVLRETVSREPLSLSGDNEEARHCHRIVRVEVKDTFNQTIHGGIENSSKTEHACGTASNCLGLVIALSSPYIC